MNAVLFFLLFWTQFVVVSSIANQDENQVIDNGNHSGGKSPTIRRYKQFEGLSIQQLKQFLGGAPHESSSRPKRSLVDISPPMTNVSCLPMEFEASTKWPKCASQIKTIEQQGNCSSSWAIATAAMITDRRCIVYNAPQVKISSWDLISCCVPCRVNKNGCFGGWPSEAISWYMTNGLVTGGVYGKGGCKPYEVSPTATSMIANTTCLRTCQASYTTKTYAADKKKGSALVYVNEPQTKLDFDKLMGEIINRGPIVCNVRVYEDLFDYLQGVYPTQAYDENNFPAYVGEHAMRLVGWGTRYGKQYLKFANSWGSGWGENGYLLANPFAIRISSCSAAVVKKD